MRLYLDDDCLNRILIRLLRALGHDVRLPADVGLSGALDASHLRLAIREQRSLITRNYEDFEALHNLILEVHGHHFGIMVILKDNNPRHDLKPPGIVRALDNLTKATLPLADQYIVLNQWR